MECVMRSVDRDWYPLVEGVLIASEFYVGR